MLHDKSKKRNACTCYTACISDFLFVRFFYIAAMDKLVNMIFHFGGRWCYVDSNLVYEKGDIDVLYDFDSNFLCYQDLLFRYKNTYGFRNVEKIFVLQPGKELKEGLFLIHDDVTVRKVLGYIHRYSWVRDIHFYADHVVDTPEIVLQIGWKDCDLLSESEDEQVRKVIREIVNECEPVTAPVTENQPENDPEIANSPVTENHPENQPQNDPEIANSPVTETHPESHPEPEHEHFSEFETQPEAANDPEFHFST